MSPSNPDWLNGDHMPSPDQSLRSRLEDCESGAQPCGPAIIGAPSGRWVVPKVMVMPSKQKTVVFFDVSHHVAEELNEALGP